MPNEVKHLKTEEFFFQHRVGLNKKDQASGFDRPILYVHVHVKIVQGINETLHKTTMRQD